MARKVFLSVLGAGFYDKCKYSKERECFCSSETRFIQVATLECLKANDWNEGDAVYVLLTEKARKLNWLTSESGKRKKFPDGPEEDYKGLEDELKKMDLKVGNKIDQDIPNGSDEDQMWDIFKVLFDLIEDGDELYVDLTHSFRYIPMLMMVFCNYAKFLKNIQVKSITYGNYEERYDGIAPIVDITVLSVLQDWTAAADEFLSTGNVNKLSRLYMPQIHERLRYSSGSDEEAQLLKSFVKNLNSLVNELKLCQGKRLIEACTINDTKQSIDEIEQVEKPKPFEPLLNEIKKSVQAFDNQNNVKNGIAAAKWCSDNGLYQQAATLLQESVVSMVCELIGLDWQKEIKRKYVNNAFNILADKKKTNNKNQWDIPSDSECDEEERKRIIEQIISLKEVQDLVKDFSTLTAYRNKINHGTMLEGQGQFRNVDTIADDIKNLTERIYNLTYCTSL